MLPHSLSPLTPPSGSNCPPPKARPGCAHALGRADINSPEMRQEQSPEPGGEPLTGLMSPYHLGTVTAAFSSQPKICFLPLPSDSLKLPQKRSLFKPPHTDFLGHVGGTEASKGWEWSGLHRKAVLHPLSRYAGRFIGGSSQAPSPLTHFWELPPQSSFTDQLSYDSPPCTRLHAQC